MELRDLRGRPLRLVDPYVNRRPSGLVAVALGVAFVAFGAAIWVAWRRRALRARREAEDAEDVLLQALDPADLEPMEWWDEVSPGTSG